MPSELAIWRGFFLGPLPSAQPLTINCGKDVVVSSSSAQASAGRENRGGADELEHGFEVDQGLARQFLEIWLKRLCSMMVGSRSAVAIVACGRVGKTVAACSALKAAVGEIERLPLGQVGLHV